MTPWSHLIKHSIILLVRGLGRSIYIVKVFGVYFLNQRGGWLQVIFLAGCHIYAITIRTIWTHVSACFCAMHIILVVVLRV